jgi:hypothetical protein
MLKSPERSLMRETSGCDKKRKSAFYNKKDVLMV